MRNVAVLFADIENCKRLTDVGFGTVEVRARRPYRVLSPRHYPTDRLIFTESVEICAINDPMPADGPRMRSRARSSAVI